MKRRVPQGAQNARLQTFFTDLMVAHEVAHQWWGNVVSIESYQDEWIPEALAHYSALLWLEKKRGADALQTELTNFRTELLELSDGKTLDSFRTPDLGIQAGRGQKSRDVPRHYV